MMSGDSKLETKVRFWRRVLRRQRCFWPQMVQNLRRHDAPTASAALSYRTIFALIPALVLIFLMFKTFGAFDTHSPLRGMLEYAGLTQIVISPQQPQLPEGQASQPATAPDNEASTQPISVADYIEQTMRDVEGKLTLGRIGPIGVLLLIWSALALLSTVERSLNVVFSAPANRAIVYRLMLYWAAVTLIPLVLASTMYAVTAAENMLGGIDWAPWLAVIAYRIGPIAAGTALLAAVYVFLPNTPVRFLPAVEGGFVAVLLWFAGRWAFGAYVGYVVAYGSLYGALGLIPLFLIWLWLSWLIFLLGAEIAAASQGGTVASAGKSAFGPAWPWAKLAVAAIFARSHRMGHVSSTRALCEELALSSSLMRELLTELESAGLLLRVRTDGKDSFVLARSADTIKVSEVLGANAYPPQRGDEVKGLPGAISAIRGRVQHSVADLTIADLEANSR